MVKVIFLSILLALGGGLVAASGYDRIEKPALNGNGPLAIQMPPGLHPPAYHLQPSEEWWAARHGERVTDSGKLQECMGCHNPQTSCNSCHSYMGVQLIVAPTARPVAVLPTATEENSPTAEPTNTLPAPTQEVATVVATSTTAPLAIEPTAMPSATATAAPSATARATAVVVRVSFVRDIQPIFRDHCADCHGAFGGLDTSSYARIMSTGDNKPVIIPGKPYASLLIQKLTGKQTIGGSMPPGGPLPPALIDLLIQWIAAGAPNN